MQTVLIMLFLCSCGFILTTKAQWELHYQQYHNFDQEHLEIGQSKRRYTLHTEEYEYLTEYIIHFNNDSIHVKNSCILSNPRDQADFYSGCPPTGNNYMIRPNSYFPLYKTSLLETTLDSCEIEKLHIDLYIWHHGGEPESFCDAGYIMHRIESHYTDAYQLDQKIQYDPTEYKFRIASNALSRPGYYWFKIYQLAENSSISQQSIIWSHRTYEQILWDNKYEGHPYTQRLDTLNKLQEKGNIEQSLQHYFNYLMEHPDKIIFPKDTLLNNLQKRHYALGRFYIVGLGYFKSNPLPLHGIVGLEIVQDWIWDDEAKKLYTQIKKIGFVCNDPSEYNARTVLFYVDYE